MAELETSTEGQAAPGPRVLFLCTGNAARSVMASVSLSSVLPGADVSSAGTHVVEGLPPTTRTEQALIQLGLRPTGHRSRQLTEADVSRAQLIVGFTREHVEFVRRRFPAGATKTVTLRRLCRDLGDGDLGHGPTLETRLARLGLAEAPLEAWEDIADPAGGELEDFERCAGEIRVLTARLARLLGAETRVDEGEN